MRKIVFNTSCGSVETAGARALARWVGRRRIDREPGVQEAMAAGELVEYHFHIMVNGPVFGLNNDPTSREDAEFKEGLLTLTRGPNWSAGTPRREWFPTPRDILGMLREQAVAEDAETTDILAEVEDWAVDKVMRFQAPSLLVRVSPRTYVLLDRNELELLVCARMPQVQAGLILLRQERARALRFPKGVRFPKRYMDTREYTP